MTLKTPGLGESPSLNTSPAYRTVQSNGSAITGRPTLNIVGPGGFVVDNSTSTRTDLYLEGPYGTPSVNNAIYIPAAPLAAQSIAAGVGYYQAFRIYRTISVDQYTVYTPTGATGATARIGIYNDDGTATPANLISGTEVSGVSLSTGGLKYGTMSSAVSLTGSSSGTTYWILTVIQGATCSMTSYTPILGTQNPGLDNQTVAAALTYKTTGQTGSLPSSNSYSATADTIAIRTALRRSA
jgi:hypothetical protein